MTTRVEDAINHLGERMNALWSGHVVRTAEQLKSIDERLESIAWFRQQIVTLNNLLFILVCITGVTAVATILLLLRHW
jgi:hypothetical protein